MQNMRFAPSYCHWNIGFRIHCIQMGGSFVTFISLNFNLLESAAKKRLRGPYIMLIIRFILENVYML